MASYTSSRTGDWDNAATWNGAGVPNQPGDTAVIANGHTVTFDQGLAEDLGDVTINTGGILVHEANMFLNGKMTINGTLHQKPGSKILFVGNDNQTHGLCMENNTNAHYIAEGSDGMPTTKTDAASDIGDIRIQAVDASKFAEGEWVAIYCTGNTSGTGTYDHSRYEDEGVWVHYVHSNNDIYFRQFVGPDDVTLAEAQGTGATQIEVTNAKVFRVGDKIIWGTAANMNIARIGTINYKTNIMTLTVDSDASSDYSTVGNNAAGTFVYKTGFTKPHLNNSRVRKCATVTTVARAATDTTITVAQDEKFEAGDIIVIECYLQTAGSVNNRDWNSYETRHIVQSRSSNTLTLTAAIGYTVPVGALVTRLTRDIEVGAKQTGSTAIDDSTNIGFFYAEHYSANYNRTLILKDVFFNNVGNNNSNFYAGFVIRGYFSTDDPPVTVGIDGNYQEMAQEPWIEGCTTMINGNGRRDYSGMWQYDSRHSAIRCGVSSNAEDGFTIHWDPSQRIYNCFAIGCNDRGLRVQGTHYEHEVAYCYLNRIGTRGIYYEPVYNPGRGLHDIKMNVIDLDPIRINRHTGYSGNMWKIDVKDSLYEGPYMSEIGGGDFACLYSRFRPIEYSSKTGVLRQSGSSYAGRQGFSNNNATFRVIEADFEYDSVINYTYYARFIWIPEEGAYLVNRTFHDQSERATVRETFYVPANSTARIRISCKPTTGFSGSEPNAFVQTLSAFTDYSTDGGDPFGGSNEGASRDSTLTLGQVFSSFESNTDYQNIDLTVAAVPFSRYLSAGVGIHNTDAQEGFYMKPIEVYLDNMPSHPDMLRLNTVETSNSPVRYGDSHGVIYRRWGGTT
tara:strand:+ start:1632 stop:4163 length:2532 start_codon:yes stop_codon:yes gene_type:complete